MLTRLRARAADERGVTLIEMLVVIVLMGIVGSVVTTSLVRGMQGSAATQSRLDALTDLQESVDRMTRELRAAAPLQTAEANRAVVVVFEENFTKQVRYTYQYCPVEGRLHVRTEGPFATPAPPAKLASQLTTPAGSIPCGTAGPLIDRVVNSTTQPVFQYFTSTATITDANALLPVSPATQLSAAQLAQVRQIRVRIVRSLPKGSGQTIPTPINVSTVVRLRNVR